MPSWTLRRATDAVGIVTLGIGAALIATPARTSAALGLGRDIRVAWGIGAVDLALAPGLLRGTPRWPWMAARAGFNAVLAGVYAVEARRPAGNDRAVTGLARMVALTVVDGSLALMLRNAERDRR
jgi:hypothetical protein